jgi:glycosyltransferase involved in cell wall biosynthesis
VSYPEVSVLMAVRDGERWLSDACRSILRQSLADLELIVVDDGSHDRSPAILAGLQTADARVRVLHQEPRGLVSALNRALDVARAPLIARLDADDLALPQRLSHQIARIEAQPKLVLLGTWAEKIDAEGRVIGRLEPETDPARLAALLQEKNPFIHSSVMMRTEIVRAVGGYREALAGAEDYDLWLRLSERGMLANLPEVLVRYRWHGGGATQRQPLRQGFSVRLATRSARSRRATGVDPADSLQAPPDWWSPEATAAFYGDDARIYRFLDASGLDSQNAAPMIQVLPITAHEMAHLTHTEKQIARRTLSSYLRSARTPPVGSRPALLKLFLVNLLARPWRWWSAR